RRKRRRFKHRQRRRGHPDAFAAAPGPPRRAPRGRRRPALARIGHRIFAIRFARFSTKMPATQQRTVFAAMISVIALATTALAQSADVGVVKTGPDFANANSDVPYTITVVSNGPD